MGHSRAHPHDCVGRTDHRLASSARPRPNTGWPRTGSGAAVRRQCPVLRDRPGRGARRGVVSRPSDRRRRARDRLDRARPGATRACAPPRAAAHRRAGRGASGSSRRPPGPRSWPAGAAAHRSRGTPKCITGLRSWRRAFSGGPGFVASVPISRTTLA